MAQWAECKPGGLSLSPSFYIKKLGVVACASPVSGKQRQEDPWGPLASQLSLTIGIQVPVTENNANTTETFHS